MLILNGYEVYLPLIDDQSLLETLHAQHQRVNGRLGAKGIPGK